MKPTDEQVKEFWEWCGFKWEGDDTAGFWLGSDSYTYCFPCIHLTPTEMLPPIDLNNLFKYAVPKLEYVRLCWQPYLNKWSGSVMIRTLAGVPNKDVVGGVEITKGIDKDPALALFWAIYKVVRLEG